MAVAVLAVLLVGGTLLMDRDRDRAVLPAAPVRETGAGKAEASASVPQTAPVTLDRVTAPPPRTVAFIDPATASAGSAYTVTFVPYGTGPTPDTLVIAVTSSEPGASVARPFAFAGRSVLAGTARLPAKMAVTKGGAYTGTIVLTRQGDVLVPMLTHAAAAR